MLSLGSSIFFFFTHSSEERCQELSLLGRFDFIYGF
jgi:hypothetical protein